MDARLTSVTAVAEEDGVEKKGGGVEPSGAARGESFGRYDLDRGGMWLYVVKTLERQGTY